MLLTPGATETYSKTITTGNDTKMYFLSLGNNLDETIDGFSLYLMQNAKCVSYGGLVNVCNYICLLQPPEWVAPVRFRKNRRGEVLNFSEHLKTFETVENSRRTRQINIPIVFGFYRQTCFFCQKKTYFAIDSDNPFKGLSLSMVLVFWSLKWINRLRY